MAGNYVLWFVVLLMLAKMVAAGLTIGIGGSGGVFAPSLFTGAMAGTAFGVIAQHVFGTDVGSPAIYGVIAMGAVFAAAAQAPLTYGTIYTTKLLRRGTDIERPKPASMLQVLTVGDVMQGFGEQDGRGTLVGHRPGPGEEAGSTWAQGLLDVERDGQPQSLHRDETLEQALRQLVLFGPEGRDGPGNPLCRAGRSSCPTTTARALYPVGRLPPRGSAHPCGLGPGRAPPRRVGVTTRRNRGRHHRGTRNRRRSR